ncbi:MAG: fluoride efflux transporter CrcB [Pedobacter sp.]|uniref:fluoride efflux transporter CrcB n=1 Tax=Pedobacter sp. TaxID=1411316 RepID=UPI002808A6DB|nr:fluoride efflux transporter CrcB [Pedobacter sp.]MDQ8003789.1 fluoride efflux transporter CrcB [Pedobacter sp.]
MLKQILLVGLGGGIGSIFRFLTSVFATKYAVNGFPLGTFMANVLGCFILGICVGVFGKNPTENENLKLLFVTGFCGGYTTFSTFASENIQLLQQQNYTLLVIYTVSSLLVGFLAVAIGLTLGKSW